MKKIILIFLMLLIPISSIAYRNSGNSYNTYHSNSNTYVEGNNFRTGSTWNTTIDEDGNMNGMNKKGESWSYDSQSGNYSNSNGKTCTGHGAGRICF